MDALKPGEFPQECKFFNDFSHSAIFFSSRKIAMNSLVFFLTWFAANTNYFGLSLHSVNIGGDIYVNFVLSGLIEIPSYLFAIVMVDGFGRKTTLVFTQLLAGSTCIAAGFLTHGAAQTALTLAGMNTPKKSSTVVIILFIAFLQASSAPRRPSPSCTSTPRSCTRRPSGRPPWARAPRCRGSAG